MIIFYYMIKTHKDPTAQWAEMGGQADIDFFGEYNI